jgi:hypothetical protein
MRSGVISRMTAVVGARPIAALPSRSSAELAWHEAHRVWNVAKPLSVPGVIGPRPLPCAGAAGACGVVAAGPCAAGACACGSAATATQQARNETTGSVFVTS